MIRNLAVKPVSKQQAHKFSQYRPLAQQDDNMNCHLRSFIRYVDLVRQKEESAKMAEDLRATANSAESKEADNPNDDYQQVSLLETFINEQTRPKTLNLVLNFLKLRGNRLNDMINLNPNINHGTSKHAVVKVIFNAINAVVKTDISGIRMFKEICTTMGIVFKNVDVEKKRKLKHQKRSFRSVLDNLPDKNQSVDMLTTLLWDTDKTFPL